MAFTNALLVKRLKSPSNKAGGCRFTLLKIKWTWLDIMHQATISIPFSFWQKDRLSSKMSLLIPGKDIKPFYYSKAHEIQALRVMEFIIPAHGLKLWLFITVQKTVL